MEPVNLAAKGGWNANTLVTTSRKRKIENLYMYVYIFIYIYRYIYGILLYRIIKIYGEMSEETAGVNC